mgnify:CR=1 FL=1
MKFILTFYIIHTIKKFVKNLCNKNVNLMCMRVNLYVVTC